jgi:hypothetical protein
MNDLRLCLRNEFENILVEKRIPRNACADSTIPVGLAFMSILLRPS